MLYRGGGSRSNSRVRYRGTFSRPYILFSHSLLCSSDGDIYMGAQLLPPSTNTGTTTPATVALTPGLDYYTLHSLIITNNHPSAFGENEDGYEGCGMFGSRTPPSPPAHEHTMT